MKIHYQRAGDATPLAMPVEVLHNLLLCEGVVYGPVSFQDNSAMWADGRLDVTVEYEEVGRVVS